MDWQHFLDENHVHYVTSGPNTKKGELSIKCPICGNEDPSEHLGINLTTGFWGCHRDQSHRGKSARTLIKALLGASSHTAQQIIQQYSKTDPDDLDEALMVLLEDRPDFVLKTAKQSLNPEFKDFYQIRPRGVTKRYFTYLQQRGFDNPQEMIDRYDLRCATTGRYKDRIIIPIHLNEELLGWTSRALGSPSVAPRYLASNGEVKTTIFNYDNLKEGGDRLIVTEGPFDAIKVDNSNFIFQRGNSRGMYYRATCTFGTSVTPSQYALLRSVSKKFKETWVLFDEGAQAPAVELASWIGAKVAYLPYGVKDPDELSMFRMQDLSSHYFDGFFGWKVP